MKSLPMCFVYALTISLTIIWLAIHWLTELLVVCTSSIVVLVLTGLIYDILKEETK
jgi:hypothetical protein